ncbi:MAG: molybdenum cofactor biosynthesis protein MoaE, partial [Nitrososphaerales archaeon]
AEVILEIIITFELSKVNMLPEAGIYQKDQIDFSNILARMISEMPKSSGAFLSFMGIARETGREGKKVVRLVMESYEEHADSTLKKICLEVKEKYGADIVRIYHYVGDFSIGQPVVLVIVSAKARAKAFAAIEEAVERYKKEPALFKAEHYDDGNHSWVSGTISN